MKSRTNQSLGFQASHRPAYIKQYNYMNKSIELRFSQYICLGYLMKVYWMSKTMQVRIRY